MDAILTADSAHRSALADFERLRAEQKAAGKEVGPLRRAAADPAATPEQLAALDDALAGGSRWPTRSRPPKPRSARPLRHLTMPCCA